ncbi:hypothetical protein [Desulfolucanica intricata]|uniref:hypothetical protein n=1 Tax=Desulfolucanica intricata TaxID=1285191 RepID=UPI0008297B21|nr:hypothetical protein [Desulfolucanica intricata]
MLFIIAGIMSAAAAWLLNNFLFGLVKERAILVAPVVEELAKTLTAILLGTSIFFTHFIFGIIEAAWDIYSSRKLGQTAALLSVGGHTGFGLAAELIFFWQQNIFYAVSAGLIMHLSWNFMVSQIIRLSKTKG